MTRANHHLPPGLSPKLLNDFSPLSPLFRHPFYWSIVLRRRSSSILATFPFSILGGSNIGVGCTTSTLTSFVTSSRLSSSHPLANVPLFYRCCAIGKPVWLDPDRLERWVDHDGVCSKTEPTSCDITIGKGNENGQRINF